MTEPYSRQPIGRAHMALYGAANLPTSVVGLPISIYVPAFYSENLGLSLVGVGNLYLFVWISLLYLGFTLVDLPYRAWGAEMSPDYHERSRVTGWRDARLGG